jgi:cytochrome c553
MVPLGRRLYHEVGRERGVPACAGCHKPDGSGTARSPLIAVQNAAYGLQQLRAFHNEQRTNDRGRLMRTTAARMTEPEMVAVAEYVAGMDVIPRQP